MNEVIFQNRKSILIKVESCSSHITKGLSKAGKKLIVWRMLRCVYLHFINAVKSLDYSETCVRWLLDTHYSRIYAASTGITPTLHWVRYCGGCSTDVTLFFPSGYNGDLSFFFFATYLPTTGTYQIEFVFSSILLLCWVRIKNNTLP